MINTKYAILSLILFLNLTCEKDFSDQYPYVQPVAIDDGLDVDSLKTVGIDENMLRKAVGRIENGKYGEVHSMLIYKDNKLVFEEYFKGHTYQWDSPGHYANFVTWNREMQHCIHSDTKSITSLCIGIAIDKGFIGSVEQSIFDFLPDFTQYKKDGKEDITIEHLLTMTSGLQWEEWKISLSSMENDQIAIWFYEDGPINYVLRKQLVATPGTHFNYSGGDIQLLAEILKNATGMNLNEFSSKYLFEPMDIKSYEWWLIFPSGEIQAASGLKLTPRAMVKVGAMMLNGGNWNGNQIIAENWVDKCMYPYSGNDGIKVPGEDLGKVGYAYTWWTKSFDYDRKSLHWYSALGWGGQKISVLPELNMVIVFTGANYRSKVHNFEIIERFILPALR
ncbi:MAG: serine hydrolase [Saprospiraceae bacterium]|nr:serine hydrolase [Saprospiraceae bacterium]